jgi:hypothetical protein
MNLRVFVTILSIVAGTTILWLVSGWLVERRNLPKGSSHHLIGALSPPSPKPAGNRGPSRQRREQNISSLDRIAGASFQEMYDFISGLSSKDLAALSAEIGKLPIGGISNAKISLFFKAWSQSDPQAAFAAAASFPQQWSKEMAMQSIFDGANPSSASELVTALNNLPPGDLSESMKTVLLSKGVIKWSQTDPSAAAHYLDAAEGRVFPPETWKQVAENWAGTEPAAALDWVQTQNGNKYAGIAMQGVISGWWQKDPAAAESYSSEHVETLSGQQAASVIANRKAFQDPAKAAEWASELSNSNARQMSELTIGAAWAHQDPEAAGKWATTLPEEDAAAAVSSVASAWALDDPESAAKWIGTMSSGRIQDEAINAFSSTVASSDPGTALEWALSASDPAMRDSNAQHIVVGWLMRQPAQAKAWVENSGLSAEDKDRLLNLAPRTGPSP